MRLSNFPIGKGRQKVASIKLERGQAFSQSFAWEVSGDPVDTEELEFRIRFWSQGSAVAMHTNTGGSGPDGIFCIEMPITKVNKVVDHEPTMYDVHVLWPGGGYSYVAKGRVETS